MDLMLSSEGATCVVVKLLISPVSLFLLHQNMYHQIYNSFLLMMAELQHGCSLTQVKQI